MQVDVGEQRRDHRALPRPHLTGRNDPVFQDTRREPFADQADDARIADAMFQKPDQPILTDRVKERAHIGGIINGLSFNRLLSVLRWFSREQSTSAAVGRSVNMLAR